LLKQQKVLLAKKQETEWASNVQLADHFGVSTMTITRWKKDPKLNFPKPRVINNREYHNLPLADEWMAAQPASKTAKAGA